MGVAEGSQVGDGVGEKEGITVGRKVGETDGLQEVGRNEGKFARYIEGACVESTNVGTADAELADGDTLGREYVLEDALVGKHDGMYLYTVSGEFSEGENVGIFNEKGVLLGIPVGTILGNNIGTSTGLVLGDDERTAEV